MGEFKEGAKRGAGQALFKVIGAVLALGISFGGGYVTGDAQNVDVPSFEQDDD